MEKTFYRAVSMMYVLNYLHLQKDIDRIRSDGGRCLAAFVGKRWHIVTPWYTTKKTADENASKWHMKFYLEEKKG